MFLAVSSTIQMMNNRLLIKAGTVAYFIPISIKNQYLKSKLANALARGTDASSVTGQGLLIYQLLFGGLIMQQHE